MAAILLCLLSAGLKAADLSFITDVEYAQDGRESTQTAIVGLELYSRKYGSLTFGVGYENSKQDYGFGLDEKSNQGLYARYQGGILIRRF